MKTLTTLLAASVCAVAATAVAAHADTTFTVSPGGAWSGTRAPDSTVGIRDAVSSQTILCSGLTASGSFRSGTGLSASNIGSLTGIAFTGCQVRGLTVTVTVHTSAANPVPLTITGVSPADPTVFSGRAENVSLTLDASNGCHAEVGAQVSAGGGPGFTGFAYSTTEARFSFAAAGKGLFIQSATAQCTGSTYGLKLKQFDRISLGGFGDSIAASSVIISPAQTITSP